jgi:hypothetical protein
MPSFLGYIAHFIIEEIEDSKSDAIVCDSTLSRLLVKSYYLKKDLGS